MRLVPRTVRARTTLAAAVVVGAAFIGTGTLVVSTLSNRLVQGQREAAELRARDIALLIVDDLPETLSIPGEDRALIQVVDRRGKVLVQGANTAGEPAILSSNELRKLHVGKTMRGLPIGDGERFAVVAMKTKTPLGPITVITAESLASADNDTIVVVRLLSLGFPLLIALVALIVFRNTRSALNPVSKMAAELGEISSDDLHRRVSLPVEDDEIGELGAAMNLLLERLERSSERERRFVADASHELRSPLASIRTALEVADTYPDQVNVHGAIRDVLADHVRLDRLVDDLLALARLDGARPSDVEAVDFALLVSVDLASRLDLCVQVKRTLGSAIVVGDERQLGRALRNLIDNALRHATVRIEISTATVGDRVFVSVGDDGPGVPMSERQFVFDRFSRLDHARALEDGGTGLGLAIVREVIEAHHGTVEITDSSFGGAEFTISLPAGSSTVSELNDVAPARFRRNGKRRA
jgi:signal transduction histidine kinase